MNRKINVLSLFDGISCGQLALKQLNIPVDNYYASEIDKNCIKVTQHHFPETIQLGDITAGMYIIRISKEGEVVNKRLFVVEN